jgi:hypothetical protein
MGTLLLVMLTSDMILVIQCMKYNARNTLHKVQCINSHRNYEQLSQLGRIFSILQSVSLHIWICSNLLTDIILCLSTKKYFLFKSFYIVTAQHDHIIEWYTPTTTTALFSQTFKAPQDNLGSLFSVCNLILTQLEERWSFCLLPIFWQVIFI